MELWDNNPRVRLEAARKMSQEEQNAIVEELCLTSPIKPWPYGMPTSVNPIVVIVGVSPGNSPDPNDREVCEAIKNNQKLSSIKFPKPTIGTPHERIYYRDTTKYWDKTRELCVAVVKKYDKTLSEKECLSLSGHLNLGLGAFGTANATSVEYPIIKWVSNILYSYLSPRIVILFGLKGIFSKDKNCLEAWNHTSGLKINWMKPSKETKLVGYKYKFSVWDSMRADKELAKIVMWPNHPSRHPFTDRGEWTKAIEQFTSFI